MPKPICQPIPNTWFVDAWPADVYPFTPSKGRALIRFHRAELVKAGALVRPAQKLVVLGPNFLGWLQRKGDRVENYDIAPNRIRKAARTPGSAIAARSQAA